MKFLDKKTESILKTIPKKWDGKQCILEMKENEYAHWKQMEWIGFYFQYICESKLTHFEIPGTKYGNTSFDGFHNVPLDFKSHCLNSSSQHKVIANDMDAIINGVNEFGYVGLIIATGNAKYDDKQDRIFQNWHEEIKGEKTEYIKKREERGANSRIRKVSFDLTELLSIKITENTLKKCNKNFQKNFKNSNGKPRKSKLVIDLKKLDKEVEQIVKF